MPSEWTVKFCKAGHGDDDPFRTIEVFGPQNAREVDEYVRNKLQRDYTLAGAVRYKFRPAKEADCG